MSKKIKLHQKPPVCPGCRKTVSDIELVHSERYIGTEKVNMLFYCCGNKGCGMILPVEVFPIDTGVVAELPPKSKIVTLN